MQDAKEKSNVEQGISNQIIVIGAGIIGVTAALS